MAEVGKHTYHGEIAETNSNILSCAAQCMAELLTRLSYPMRITRNSLSLHRRLRPHKSPYILFLYLLHFRSFCRARTGSISEILRPLSATPFRHMSVASYSTVRQQLLRLLLAARRTYLDTAVPLWRHLQARYLTFDLSFIILQPCVPAVRYRGHLLGVKRLNSSRQ